MAETEEKDSPVAAGAASQESVEEPPPRPKRRRTMLLLVLLSLLVVCLGGWMLWRYFASYVTTDDAQVDGHIDLVSARISGTVTYIIPGVENSRFVKAGTLLVELDPRDYETEMEHARANLDTRTAEARSAQIAVPIVDANAFGQLHAAEAAKGEALASV